MDAFFSIKLNKQSSTPLYRQLGDGLHLLIKRGVLKPHSKLPPIRAVAGALRLNSVTVVNAYKYLERKKVVYSQIGSGTYVSEASARLLKPAPPLIPSHGVIDFAGYYPDLDSFPTAHVKAAANELFGQSGGAFLFVENYGFTQLRELIAERFSKTYAAIPAEQIIISAGATEAYETVDRLICGPDDCVVVEKPSRPGVSSAFRSGIKIVRAPMCADGMDIAAFMGVVKKHKPKLVCVMPVFQNPTGVCYSRENMRKLLELAAQHDFYIIEEDGYIGVSGNEKTRRESLFGMDGGERVFFIDSATKLALPGVLMSYIVMPPGMVSREGFEDAIPPSGNGAFVQRLVHAYLKQPGAEADARAASERLAARREALIEAISTYLPELVTYVKPMGGVNIWLTMHGKRMTAQALAEKLYACGVLIAPGHLFGERGAYDYCFRLSCANVRDGDVSTGIRLIKETMQGYDGPFSPLNY